MKSKYLVLLLIGFALIFSACCKMDKSDDVIKISYSQTDIADTLMGVYTFQSTDTMAYYDTLFVAYLSSANDYQTEFYLSKDIESLTLFTKVTHNEDVISDVQYEKAGNCGGYKNVSYQFNGVQQKNDDLRIRY